MAKIHKLKKENNTIYPITVSDAVINPDNNKILTLELREKVSQNDVKQELGDSTTYPISQKAVTENIDRIMSYNESEMLKVNTTLSLISNVVIPGRNLLDTNMSIRGKYFNFDNGLLEVSSTLAVSNFIKCNPNTTYYCKFLTDVIVFDSRYNKIALITASNRDTIETPANAKFVIINYDKNYSSAYFSDMPYGTRNDFYLKLVDSIKTGSTFPFSGRYPFSETKIREGVDKAIVNIYVDVPEENGYSIVPAIIRRNTKTVSIYKQIKDVLVKQGTFTHLFSLDNAVPIEGTNLHFLTTSFNKSWAIVDFTKITVEESDNNWDCYGCELDPRVLKGGIWSNFVTNDMLESTSNILNDTISDLNVLLSVVSNVTNTYYEVGETALNYTESATKLTALYNRSTFSGYGFNIGIVPKSFRWLKVKVQSQSWATEVISKVLIQIKNYDNNGEVLYSRVFNLENPINIGETRDLYINLTEDLNFAESLFLEIRFNSLGTVFIADASTSGVEDTKSVYFINGNIEKSNKGIATSGGSQPAYTKIYFALYTSVEEKRGLSNELLEYIEKNIVTKDNIEINLPDKIYAIVGDTMQLFYRGIIKAVNPYNYDISIICSKGKRYPRYFEYTPTASDIGETTLKVCVKNNSRLIIASKECLLVTRSVIKSPIQSLKVACFGDSLTSGGIWCKEAHRRLTGNGGIPIGNSLSNIQFVGKKKIDNVGYFGVGGWQWESYTTKGRPAYRFYVSGVTSLTIGSTYLNNGNTFTIMEINITGGTGNILCSVGSLTPAPLSTGTLTKSSGSGDASIMYTSVAQDTQNPLWDYENNKMTFIPYANEVAGGTLDVVYTLLTWNSLTAGREDFHTIIDSMKVFANTLHLEFPNCKLKILGIQIPSINGGMGSNYGASGEYSDTYGMITTVFNMNKAYLEFANSLEYNTFVEFVNVSSQFDSEYNMPYTLANVNTRSQIKENIGTNGVHPNNDGYMQIADIVYRNFVANFCL